MTSMAIGKPMDEGCFALLDCLGFKGLWDRGADPHQIVQFLEATKSYSENLLVRDVVETFAPDTIKVSVAFVSDTVAISAQLTKAAATPDWFPGYLVYLVSQVCLDIVDRFLFAPKPLLFRGCLAYGRHIVRESFFLGPAVDETASFAETSQGAFIWLTPSAETLYRSFADTFTKTTYPQRLPQLPTNMLTMMERLIEMCAAHTGRNWGPPDKFATWWKKLTNDQRRIIVPIMLRQFILLWRYDNLVHDYPMPLKTGGTLTACILNPLYKSPPPVHPNIITRMLSSFDKSSLDVLVKKQNTGRFLAAASKATQHTVDKRAAALQAAYTELERAVGVPM